MYGKYRQFKIKSQVGGGCQLNIRVRKLGGFSLNISDMISIDDVDKILLTSKNGISAYQKVLKTYINQ